jgi:hypothetical protein
MFVALVIILYQRWWSAPEPVRSATLTTNQRDIGGLSVKAWTGVNRVFIGRGVPFWISFANHSPKTLTSLRVRGVSVEGFRLDPRCWDQYRQPTCLTGPATSLPATLAPGQSIEVNGILVAGDEDGAYRPSITYEWADGDQKAHRDVIWLGPLQIVDFHSERFHLLGRRLLGILKDILIPLLIFVGGYLYQKWSQDHAETHQVKQAMLPRLLNDAQKHYLQVVSRMGRLRRYSATVTAGRSALGDQCLWSLLIFMKQMKVLVDHLGGFHLTNRKGEEVIGQCYGAFAKAAEVHLDLLDLSAGIKAINVGEDFASCSGRFHADPVFVNLRNRFDVWISDPADPLRDSAPALEIFGLVLVFEINSPFERWYGEPETFPREELRKQKDALAQRFEGIKKSLEDYLGTRVSDLETRR